MYMAIIDWMHGQMVFHLVIYFLAAWSEIVSSSVYIELEGKEHVCSIQHLCNTIWNSYIDNSMIG